jgi:hypothetical protein
VHGHPDRDSDTETSTPLWVKVFGVLFLAAVLLFLILMFTRGPHRPGAHTSSGATGSDIPIQSGHR